MLYLLCGILECRWRRYQLDLVVDLHEEEAREEVAVEVTVQVIVSADLILIDGEVGVEVETGPDLVTDTAEDIRGLIDPVDLTRELDPDLLAGQ